MCNGVLGAGYSGAQARQNQLPATDGTVAPSSVQPTGFVGSLARFIWLRRYIQDRNAQIASTDIGDRIPTPGGNLPLVRRADPGNPNAPVPPAQPNTEGMAADAMREQRRRAAYRFGLSQTRTAGLGSAPPTAGATLLGG